MKLEKAEFKGVKPPANIFISYKIVTKSPKNTIMFILNTFSGGKKCIIIINVPKKIDRL